MADAEDIKNAEMLVKHGFFKKGKWSKDPKEREKEVRLKGGAQILKDGEVDMEKMEYRAGEFINTSYPAPKVRHVLSVSEPNYTVLEKSYLWILNHVSLDFKMTKSIKITDTYGSSTSSTQWHVMNERMNNNQRNISNIMQTVGSLVKEMFPMVHELTMWKERLRWHDMSDNGDPAGDKALKGAWTDVVEGGPENNGSIFGLARNANFVTLPDLFFSVFVQKPEDVDKVVDEEMKDFSNQQVKSILKRKLVQYLTWKENTRKEIEQRWRFTVRYLRQHISAIKLQLSWLRPYLQQMKYLRQNSSFQDSAQLISSFDTSKFEIETLCTKKNDKKYKPIVLMNFQYLSFPERTGPTYPASGFQHSGTMTVTFRGYVWTDEQIENYQKMRDEESMELLGELDAGFKDAMDELGKEIKQFIESEEMDAPETDSEKTIRMLEEKLEKYEKDDDEKPKRPSMGAEGAIYQPFADVGKGFMEMGKMFLPSSLLNIERPDKAAYAKKQKEEDEKKSASVGMKVAINKAFINYRKAHQMITW